MKILTTLFLVLLHCCVFACDICGNFMGITPYDNQSQLSLLHRYRVFNGYRNYQQRSVFFMPGAYRTTHNPAAGDSTVEIKNHSARDYESYKVFELRAKYFLHPRWEINAIVPLQQIKTDYDGMKQTNTGLVDPSFFTAVHLIRRLSGYKFRQRLIAGAGIKLPLGNYKKENAQLQRLSLLTQNGTGSFDHFYYLNYLISSNRFGISSNSLYKINGRNKFNEKLANSYNQVLSLFMRLKIKSATLFPSLLLNYEYCRGLMVNQQLESGTNMNLLLVGPALDLSYKKATLNLSYQFNAYERVNSQSLSTSGRLVVGLTFNFSQEKYFLWK